MLSSSQKNVLEGTEKKASTSRRSIVSKSSSSRLSVGAVILQAQQAALVSENDTPNVSGVNTPMKLSRLASVNKSRPSTGMKSLSNHIPLSSPREGRRVSMSSIKSGSSTVSGGGSARRQSINTVMSGSTSSHEVRRNLFVEGDSMEDDSANSMEGNISLDALPLPSVPISPTKSLSSVASSCVASNETSDVVGPLNSTSDQRTQVMIRVRPCENLYIGQPNGTTLSFGTEKGSKKYAFDSVFGSQSSQEELFTRAGAPALQSVVSGFNATIMAYGQTGSGKTHTVKGTASDPGLVPRCVQSLFDQLSFSDEQNSLCISYLEVYKEEVFDLLSAKDSKLSIRKKEQGFHAEGLSQVPVQSVEEALRVLNSGDLRRRVSSTKQNDRSSRSHAILTFTLNRKDPEGGDYFVSSKLNLVDLAGSERYNSDKGSESVAINKSLTNLALVIKNIVENAAFVNYRDSELTKLLQDSLSGQSRTTLIACVHGDKDNCVETLSTLRFANTAKNIPVRAEKWGQGVRVSRVEMERRLGEFRKLNEHLLNQQAVLHSQIEEERKLQQEHLLPQVEKIIKKLDSVGLGANSGRFNWSLPQSPTANLNPSKLAVINPASPTNPLSPLRQFTNSLNLDEQSKSLYNNLAGLVKVTDFLVSQYQPGNQQSQLYSPTSMKMIASLSSLSPNSAFKRNMSAVTGFTANNNNANNLTSPVVSKKRALIRLHAELVAQEARNRSNKKEIVAAPVATLELDEIAQLKLLLAQKDAILRAQEEELIAKDDQIAQQKSQMVQLSDEVNMYMNKIGTANRKCTTLETMYTALQTERDALFVENKQFTAANQDLTVTNAHLTNQITQLHCKIDEFTTLLSGQQAIAMEAVQMHSQESRRQSNFSDQMLDTIKSQMCSQNDRVEQIEREKQSLIVKLVEKEQLSIELTTALQSNLEKKERLRAQIQHLCANKLVGNEDIEVDSDVDVDEEQGREYCQNLLGLKTVPRRISTGRSDCPNTAQPVKKSSMFNISMFTSGLRASRERNRRIAQIETQK